MKRIISTLVAVLLTAVCLAQVPQKFNYQAIARTSTGEFIKNSFVEVEFAVLDGGATGTEVYKEKHMVNTDANGLISAQVGGGTVLAGDFSKIDWSKGSFWLQTRLDAGNGYELLGAQELLSVPYAIQAKEATVARGFVDENGNEYKFIISGGGNMTLNLASTTVPKKVKFIENEFVNSADGSPEKQLYLKTEINDLSIDAGLSKMEYSIDNNVFNPIYFSKSFDAEKNEYRTGFNLYVPQGDGGWGSLFPHLYIRLTPGNEAGEGEVSEVYKVVFPANTVVNPVSNVSFDSNNDLIWDSSNSDVTNYVIEYKHKNDVLWSELTRLIPSQKIKKQEFGVGSPSSDWSFRIAEVSGIYTSPFVEFSIPCAEGCGTGEECVNGVCEPITD